MQGPSARCIEPWAQYQGPPESNATPLNNDECATCSCVAIIAPAEMPETLMRLESML